jgi:predicted enzyme related to lactoylglutathione lyase
MNPVTWFSIPAEDVDRASTFYNQAFGWQVQPRTQETNDIYDYNVVINSESDVNFNPVSTARVNGCIVKKATGISTPVVLVEVDDLEAAARKVLAAGGSVVSGQIPMKSLDGVFVLVRDPDGNMVEVFKAND